MNSCVRGVSAALWFTVIVVIALAALTAGGAQGADRNVQCRVQSGGKVQFNGTCRFGSEAGGSFTLENVDRNKPLFEQVLVMSVAIVSPSVAEVRGLTRDGINSRWGEARRSTRDSACWEGSDFTICAH
jgi:hypothetical protein